MEGGGGLEQFGDLRGVGGGGGLGKKEGGRRVFEGGWYLDAHYVIAICNYAIECFCFLQPQSVVLRVKNVNVALQFQQSGM